MLLLTIDSLDPAVGNSFSRSMRRGCARFAKILLSARLLWTLCSVDFHTLTLQLFCGAWTPSYCEFTSNFSKISTPPSHQDLSRLHLFTLTQMQNSVLVVATLQSIQQYQIQGCARFAEIASELTKAWSSGATEFGVWIGNCNVKVWKSTEDKLHKIWNSKYFSQISAKRAHPRGSRGGHAPWSCKN